jgi:hypothetical protein
MSYDRTSYWFDEFKPNEALCLALINKGMKWHKKDKVFEDCYGVFWPEEAVFAVVDKLVHQTVYDNIDELAGGRPRPRSKFFEDLMIPSSSLIDVVTHLSLENLGRHLQNP